MDGRESQNRSLTLATYKSSNIAAQIPESVSPPIRTSAADIPLAGITIEKI